MNKYLLCFLLFLVAFAPRLFLMNSGLFHHDSAQLAKAIEDTVETGTIHPAVGGRYGLVLVYSIPYIFIKDSYLVATIMTILFASLSIVILYLLVKELFNNEFIAISTSLLFCFCPLYFSITTYAKSHAMGLFFILLTLYLFILSLKRKSTILSFFTALTFLFSLSVRIDNILYIPLFITLYLLCKYKNQSILYWTAILIPILVVFIVNKFIPILFKYGGDKIMLNFNTIIYLMTAGAFRLMVGMHLLSFILLGIFIVWLFFKKYDNALILCGIWFASIWLPMSMLNVSSARFWSASLVPLFILISFGLWLMYTEYHPIAFVTLFMLIIIMFVSMYPVYSYRHTHNNPNILKSILNTNIPENSYVILGDYSVFARNYINLENGDVSNKKVYALGSLYNLSYTTREMARFEWEDFHHSELNLKLRNETLLEVLP